MRSWYRKRMAWLALALMLMSLPGPVSKACACSRMKSECETSAATQLAKKECARCALASGLVEGSRGGRQMSRASCCRSKVADARAAEAPARTQIERPLLRNVLPAAVAPVPAGGNERPHSNRAPPARGRHDSAAPPASYLSDYLRL